MASDVSITRQKKMAGIRVYVGLLVIVLVYLLPVFWVGITSFKPGKFITSWPPMFLFKPTLDNFVRLQTQWHFFNKLFNSLVIASGVTGICIGIGALAAYALSRLKIKRKDLILLWILSHRFLPIAAILFPIFLLFGRTLKLTDTYLGVILPLCLPNLAFSIWLMQSFFSEIPVEIEEAGRIDGCSNWQLLWRVVFPIAKPAIAVTALFVFLFSWNEFFIPLVLTRIKVPTVTVGFAAFRQYDRVDWGGMSAGALVCLGPVLLMVVLLHRHIVRGLTLGAVKE